MSRFRLLASMVAMAVLATLVLAPTAHATFPARNGLIAFMADTGGGYQLYTVRPNGRDLRQITHVDGDAIKPDWSPDGRRIAFALNECSVAIMNADGSNLTFLPSQTPGGCEGDPSFTPDGSRLVYERYDPSIEDDAVWSMSLDGSDLFQVTPSIGVAFKHDWAPDGRHLAITDNGNDLSKPANIATIRPDGTGLRYLTHYRSPELRAYVGSYSPDGQWIVFRLENHGSYGLYRMRPDGSDLHPILPPSSFRPRNIDWGPAQMS